MFAKLMTSRRFAPLFLCQLFSALNDNFLKNALGMLILFGMGTTMAYPAEQATQLIVLSGIVLLAPSLFLSALGGELADRFDKGRVAAWLKLAEIPIAGLAALGFVLHSVPVLFVALAGFGIIIALFGPLKYGFLPERLSTEELATGNALVEGATFLAILAGTIFGGVLMTELESTDTVVAIVMVLAIACWVSARLIPFKGPAAPDLPLTKNVLASTLRLLGELKSESRLWTGGHIVSFFWMIGFGALSLLPSLIKDAMGATQSAVTLGLAAFTVGIAIGSTLAARASHTRPNLALVPIGAFLMAVALGAIALMTIGLTPPAASAPRVSAMDLLASATGLKLMAALILLSIAGGFYIVPSFAAVQSWAAPERRARVVAAVNVLNTVYMIAGGGLLMALGAAGLGLPWLFAALGIISLGALVLVLYSWGKDGARDLAKFLFKFFFKLEVTGEEHLPAPGTRAIIAPNHVSLLDGPLMHAILPGHASFAIDTAMAAKWWVRPFASLINAHTMDPTKPMATRTLVGLVKDGAQLVIFPEGRITVTGGLMKVYDGTAMIADKADAVIVPVRIEGLERSPFGYLSKGQIRKALFPRISVAILPPRKLAVDAGLFGKARRQAAGLALQDIMVDTAVETARIDQTLFSALAEAQSEKATKQPQIEDPLGTRLTSKKLTTGAQVLGAKLAPLAPEGAAVGVLLPNTAGVVVTFFALQSIGRVAAMLNYTAGTANVAAACRAAKVEVIVTSRAFVEKGRLGPMMEELGKTIRIVHLEDVRAAIGFADKVRGMLRGAKPQAVRQPSDPAVILFTSGSEGTPKGVVLSHRNLLANAAQCLARIAANGEDKVFNVLPVFHSFGLTGGLLMPLIGGVPVYLYPSPLHYRIVPELVYGTNATILFGTDTFLNGYARVAHPYDFHNVRLVMAGAEPVKERTRKTYADRFGVRVLEGYGVTETAPVLAMNTPIANRAGTVGRISPLMKARLEPVPGIEEGGRLYVAGPNVMLGYYRAESPGVLEPPQDGWHDTGDIVTIDAQGYVTIRGRAKRFAKIGGEMISLAASETLATEVWPASLSMVVTVPDARKGERLVLITQEKTATRSALLQHARAKGANEMMVPAEIMVVDRLPLLGSGKPDYVAATALAREKARPEPAQDEAAA